jgi:hypothetical protein
LLLRYENGQRTKLYTTYNVRSNVVHLSLYWEMASICPRNTISPHSLHFCSSFIWYVRRFVWPQKRKKGLNSLAIIPLPFEHVTVFVLFTSIWTGVIVIPSAALVPLYLQKWSSPVTLVIEAAALALWLAVFITITVFLHRVGYNYGGNIRSAWISTTVLSALEWYVNSWKAIWHSKHEYLEDEWLIWDIGCFLLAQQ